MDTSSCKKSGHVHIYSMNYPDICHSCKKSQRVANRNKCQECLDKDNLKSSARFREKAQRGECYYCKSLAVAGGRLCQRHLDKRRAYDKDRRSVGCDKCGKPREKGCLCYGCWEKRMVYLKQRRDGRVAAKLCQFCSKPVLVGRLCDECRINKRQARADLKLIRQQLGLCLKCGKEKFDGATRCVTCFLKDIAHCHFGQRKLYVKLFEILDRQNGFCPYTGEKLVLGQNATLDHKVSRARGGSSDLFNLQWVYKGDFDVNWMKGMMSEEEFFVAIKKIYHFVKQKGAYDHQL